MKTINTIKEFENNMKNAMDFIFSNEKAVLSAFNELLMNDEDLKNEFLSYSDDEKKKNYKALINSIIFYLATKEIK